MNRWEIPVDAARTDAAVLRSDIIRFGAVSHEVTVALHMTASGEVYGTAEDHRAFQQQRDELARNERNLPTPTQIRAIRERVGVSQRRMSEVLGGGNRSFQKYESGQAVPSIAMANLLLLVNKDPKFFSYLETHRWSSEAYLLQQIR